MNRMVFAALVLMIGFLTINTEEVLAVTSAGYSTQGLNKKDLDSLENRVDTAIKVLGVLKEELKDEKANRPDAAEAQTEEQWSDSLRNNIQRLKRMWTELKDIRNEEVPSSGGTPPPETDNKAWRDNMKRKLDKSIKAMEVLREELDKEETK